MLRLMSWKYHLTPNTSLQRIETTFENFRWCWYILQVPHVTHVSSGSRNCYSINHLSSKIPNAQVKFRIILFIHPSHYFASEMNIWLMSVKQYNYCTELPATALKFQQSRQAPEAHPRVSLQRARIWKSMTWITTLLVHVVTTIKQQPSEAF